MLGTHPAFSRTKMQRIFARTFKTLKANLNSCGCRTLRIRTEFMSFIVLCVIATNHVGTHVAVTYSSQRAPCCCIMKLARCSRKGPSFWSGPQFFFRVKYKIQFSNIKKWIVRVQQDKSSRDFDVSTEAIPSYKRYTTDDRFSGVSRRTKIRLVGTSLWYSYPDTSLLGCLT